MIVCGISYKDGGKVYHFDINGLQIKQGDYVIVDTEKGEQFGKVVFVEEREIEYSLKPVLRIATKTDYNKYLKTLKEAQDALKDAKKFASDLKLDMQFVDASFTFDRKQLIFNFIADERIDFRELVKMLAAKYKMRIDLHQIGVRDKAKEINGIGPCGRMLCCATYLNHLDTISINMAKNQNIALNPSKINGSCGRLLCCLAFEDSTYSSYRDLLPEVGSEVKYEGKKYPVASINILNMSYTIVVNGEEKEIKVDEKHSK